MADALDIVTASTSTTTTAHTGIIPAQGLREMLGLPDGARLFVDVPSGGDYSGCRLSLGDDVQLQAQWEVTETK